MQTHQITTYSINELSPEAKAKAIEKHRDTNVFYGWWTFTFEQFPEEHDCLGLDISDIQFSGFWSQGDGASFEYSTTAEDWQRWLSEQPNTLRNKAVAKTMLVTVTGSRKSYPHYVHENMIVPDYELDETGEVDMSDYDNIWEYAETLASDYMEDVHERARDLMRQLYRMLEEEYNYLTSDEAVVETLEANDYQFTKKGKTYNF